jgi:hypothetical protein
MPQSEWRLAVWLQVDLEDVPHPRGQVEAKTSETLAISGMR